MQTCKATILVVDDDAEALQIEVAALSELGYVVIPSDSAAEALELVAGKLPIDLLLTDLVMPGDINGSTLANRARRLRPKLKVVFTSGYVAGSSGGEMSSNGIPLVSKPWRLAELARCIERALGR